MRFASLVIIVLLAFGCSRSQRLVFDVASVGSVAVERFTLSARSTSQSDPGALTGKAGTSAPLTAAVSVDSVLELATLSTDGERTLRAVRLTSATVQVRMNETTGRDDKLEETLGEWTTFEVDRQGVIGAVYTPERRADLAQGLTFSLLSALQVSPQTQAIAEREEMDSSGRLIARLTRDREHPQRVRKQKLKYRMEQPGVGELNRVYEFVPSGHTTADFDEAGRLVALRVDEELRTEIASGTIGRTTTRLVLRTIRPAALSLDTHRQLVEDRVNLEARPLWIAGDDSGSERAHVAAKAKESSMANVVAQIEAGRVTPELTERLEAHLVLAPQRASEIGRIASRSDIKTTRMIITSLLRAGHPAAQSAVCAAIQSSRDPSAILSMIGGLGRVKSPTVETIACLKGRAEHRTGADARTARLALGSAARRLMETDVERALAIGEWIAGGLDSCSDADRTHWLRVAGNAGAAVPSSALLVHAEFGDETVRTAALWALRFSRDPLARAVVVAGLTDSSLPVAKAARRALSFRTL